MSMIKDKREAQGLKAAFVAKKARMSPSKLSKIENGRQKLKVSDLARLAYVLGCPIQDLIEEEQNGWGNTTALTVAEEDLAHAD